MSRFFTALLIGALCFLGCDDPPPMTAVEQFAAGVQALEAGEAVDAEAVFRAMLAEDPTDPVVRAGLARALVRQDRFAEAIVHDKLALAADPQLAEVSYNLACTYAALGEREESLRWLSRAWDGGIRDINLIEQDPDLDPLRQDHRFAFFLATGALSLQEQEAFVRVTPVSAIPGQEVRVQLAVVSLNRPLMANPERLDLTFKGELAAGGLEPRSRVERFQAGESGGREFFQRELTFTFEAREAMEAMMGPFELSLDGKPLQVRPAWVSVDAVLADVFVWEGKASGNAPGAVYPAADWFQPPGTLTEEADYPFARWSPLPTATDTPAPWELVVGVEVESDGIQLPEGLELELGGRAGETCGEWRDGRMTAFLRTRAEGASRVWFHRDRVGLGVVGPAGCPSPLPVRVRLGNETFFETTVEWPPGQPTP